MSRRAKIEVFCITLVVVGFVLRIFDGPYVILGAVLATAGIVAVIVEEYRRVQRGRPKPPWPPAEGDET